MIGVKSWPTQPGIRPTGLVRGSKMTMVSYPCPKCGEYRLVYHGTLVWRSGEPRPPRRAATKQRGLRVGRQVHTSGCLRLRALATRDIASIAAIIVAPNCSTIWDKQASTSMKKVYQAYTLTMELPEVGNSILLLRLWNLSGG